ncbi:hypothetical protein BJQ90_02812 [Arthrobacter sp. SO3]|nr:hypothetical protein [Arthrobacter sp. SO3]
MFPQETGHHHFAFRHQAVHCVEGVGGDAGLSNSPAGARVESEPGTAGADLFGQGEDEVPGPVKLREPGCGLQCVDVERPVLSVEIAFHALAKAQHPVEAHRRDHVLALDGAAAAVAQLDDRAGTRAGEGLDDAPDAPGLGADCGGLRRDHGDQAQHVLNDVLGRADSGLVVARHPERAAVQVVHPAEILRVHACRIAKHVRPVRQAVAEGITLRAVFKPVDLGQVSHLPGDMVHVDPVVPLLRMPGDHRCRLCPSGRREAQRKLFPGSDNHKSLFHNESPIAGADVRAAGGGEAVGSPTMSRAAGSDIFVAGMAAAVIPAARR